MINVDHRPMIWFSIIDIIGESYLFYMKYDNTEMQSIKENSWYVQRVHIYLKYDNTNMARYTLPNREQLRNSTLFA